MKRKRIPFILLFLSLTVSLSHLALYANHAIKDIEYLKGSDFVQLYFKINKMIPIPDVFYPDKEDNTRIVMRISDVTFDLKKEQFKFDSSVIDTIKVIENTSSYVEIEIRLKSEVNYRVFTNAKGLYIEFPKTKTLRAANKDKNGNNKPKEPGLNINTVNNVNTVKVDSGVKPGPARKALPSPPPTQPTARDTSWDQGTLETSKKNLIKDIIIRKENPESIKFEFVTTQEPDFIVIPITKSPFRLAIDFKNTRSKRIQKLVNHLNVKKVRGAYNTPSVFRVVFDLLYLKNYRVSPGKKNNGENIVEVEFFNKERKMMANNTHVPRKPNKEKVEKKEKPKAVTPRINTGTVPPPISDKDIQDIDVNEGKIEVETVNGSRIITLDNSDTKKITANNNEDFFDGEKSRVLGQDITEQSTDAGLDAGNERDKTLDQITLLDQTIRGGKRKYLGEPMGFNFHNADLKDVIKIIAKISGLNIVMDPGVSGRVTSQLRQVPWDQALELFLKINGLDMIQEGNILRIGKVDKLAAEAQKRRQLREAKQMEDELEVFTKHLSFAKVGEVSSLLRNQLSKRGKILQDARTNTLIISDVPDKITDLKRLIKTLDTPPLQVSIEARIVETEVNYVESFGIQWGYNFIADAAHGNQTTLKFPNSIGVSGNQLISQTSPFTGPLGGYAVNLPATGSTSGTVFSLGNVANTFRLDMALSAMESKGKGRIISAPKTTTQNNMQASIMQGKQIPVQTIQNNTVTVVYRPAALELRVKPQITPDGNVITELSIDNNSADFGNLVNGIPPITTQSIRTTVMVPDGGTIVIGGMYKVEKSTTREGVPVLSRIPLLGSLFKNSNKRSEQKELLVFITPRIIKLGD